MNRLTDENGICANCEGIAYCRTDCFNKQMYDRLKHYEDLEKHGELVLFPNFAYFIKDGKVYKGWVQEVVHCICRKPLYDIRYDDSSLVSYRGYLGNTVFLTEEEATNRIKAEF